MEDEALYGYWGLQIATGSDAMLDREPVDKPPVFLYTLALTFLVLRPARPHAGHDASMTAAPLVGGHLECSTPGCWAETRQIELESRLPSLFASTAAIALLYSLGRGLYQSAGTGLLAALLLALSPFAVLFGSTAFVDPMLTMWVLGAMLAASAGRMGLSGVLSGLAVATKQQGLLFVPLIVMTGALIQRRESLARPSGGQDPSGRRRLASWLLFLLGFGVVIGATVAWDQARVQRPGFFEQSIVSYGGLALASTSDLGERARSWLKLAGTFWEAGWLNGLFLAALMVSAVAAGLTAVRQRQGRPSTGRPITLDAPNRSRPISWVISLFLLLFLLVHWLIQIQVWDRYLLVVVPLIALLVARALVSACGLLPSGRWRAAYLPAMAVLLSAGLASPILAALQDRIPIGGDHGAYDGMDELAVYAREELPSGAVLYDHWLGYHYRFYLYGAPLHIHWYPDLVDLAQDAVTYCREPRYITFPSWKDQAPDVDALADAGVSLAPVFEAHRRDGTVSFRLLQLVGP